MTIKDIIGFLDENGTSFEFIGDENTEITGFSSLANYLDGSLTWIKKATSYDEVGRPVNISCGIVQDDVIVDFRNSIRVSNSKEVFFGILHHFWGNKIEVGSIGENTVVSEDADIAATASIGANCSIIGNVIIGSNTIVEHNVVIQGKVKIGERCHIQSGAVIGIDGYGYSQDPVTKKKTMIEHFGGVEIGNDVFIGSHVNIARGTIDNTVIESGVKIAPSTHIGHNNYIGKDAAIICSTLYGSGYIGDRAYITDSTISNQMSVGDDTVIGMGSVVNKPIEAGVVAYGIPAVTQKVNNSGL